MSVLLIAALLFSLPAAARAAAPPKTDGKKEEKLPEPEVVSGQELLTRDGVQLTATFYPSDKGKDAVPVILLHMFKGDRSEYANLVPALRKEGHAVLVPDLRGHGDSKTQLIGAGMTRDLDAARLRPDDFHDMVRYDMETLKALLMTKNNAGELNIEKLCVVGAEMGASVALDWARHDWSWPMLVGKKQGQDVKALVLISPKFNFPGLNLQDALSHPAVRSRLSVLIVVGYGDSRAAGDARRVESMFKRYHPDPADDSQRDLFFVSLDTKLQGTKILGVQGIKLHDRDTVVSLESGITAFIKWRLVNQTFPWSERP